MISAAARSAEFVFNTAASCVTLFSASNPQSFSGLSANPRLRHYCSCFFENRGMICCLGGALSFGDGLDLSSKIVLSCPLSTINKRSVFLTKKECFCMTFRTLYEVKTLYMAVVGG